MFIPTWRLFKRHSPNMAFHICNHPWLYTVKLQDIWTWIATWESLESPKKICQCTASSGERLHVLYHMPFIPCPLCGDLAWTDDLVIAYYSSFPDPDTLSAGNILILIYCVSLIYWSWKRFGSKHKRRSFSQRIDKENLSWFRYWCVHPVEARFLHIY